MWELHLLHGESITSILHYLKDCEFFARMLGAFVHGPWHTNFLLVTKRSHLINDGHRAVLDLHRICDIEHVDLEGQSKGNLQKHSSNFVFGY